MTSNVSWEYGVETLAYYHSVRRPPKGGPSRPNSVTTVLYRSLPQTIDSILKGSATHANVSACGGSGTVRYLPHTYK